MRHAAVVTSQGENTMAVKRAAKKKAAPKASGRAVKDLVPKKGVKASGGPALAGGSGLSGGKVWLRDF